MTAADYIHNDPILFTSYRIGVMKQRIDTINLALQNGRHISDVQVAELDCYKEELSTLKHLNDILIKNNLK